MSLWSFLFALLIGIVVASFRVGPVKPLRIVGTIYVETVRNTPLFAQMLLWGFGLTKVGIKFDLFTTAVIVLSIYTGSFIAETVRAGIFTVASGQAEAARAIGLGFLPSLRHVIMPQAVRAVAAPIGSLFIANHKNTAIAVVLGVAELLFQSEKVAIDTAKPAEALIGVTIGYLIVTYPAGLLVGMLERRVAIKR